MNRTNEVSYSVLISDENTSQDDNESTKRGSASYGLASAHDAKRRQTVNRLLGVDDDRHDAEPINQINPALAMKLLLQHVKLDPDGGILNLKSDVEDFDQLSKVKALKKGALEKALALLAMFRTIANPAAVVFFALRMLHGYIWRPCWIKKLEEATAAMRLPIPALGCFVVVAVAELVHAAFLLCSALKHRIEASCWRGKTHEDLNPAYIALSLFYWFDLPYLQTFSALTPLGLIHPNLITKNVKVFSLVEDAARCKLEAFLRLHSDSFDDTHIVKKVLGLLVQYECKDDVEKGRQIVIEHLDCTAYQMLTFLQKSSMAQDHVYLKKMGLDPHAIFGCRFKLLLWAECITMFSLGTMCLLLGGLTFLTKVCRCYALFIDTEINVLVPWAFFLAFLNQILGIIPISRLLRWRIECFVFGGTDSYVASEEEFIMRIYMASLAEAVWRNEKFTWFDKMCVMFQLDDDDLQQLIVEDSTAEKSVLSLQVRKYMNDTKARSCFKDKLILFASGRRNARRVGWV